MNRVENIEYRSTILLRLVGYGLLLFAFLDVVTILVPPAFTNPTWEFQVLGELVERVPVPLIGLAFVFYGEKTFRTKLEKLLLKGLSWTTLTVGILFLLLLPLGINNTWRINDLNNRQINEQIAKEVGELQQFQNLLEQAKSTQELQQLFASLNSQNQAPKEGNAKQLKLELLSQLNARKQQIQTRAESTRKVQQFTLIKSSIKWNLGTLIAAGLFLSTWYITEWARR